MSFFDIFNHIEFKGDKAKILLKWVLGIAVSGVIGAFMFGQIKTNLFNKIDNIQILAKQNKENTTELQTKMTEGFDKIDKKIDGVYIQGSEAFEEYRIFNKKQLELIVEFGQSNKEVNRELLSKMLEINSEEKAQQIENRIENARREKPENPIKNTTITYPVFSKITDIQSGISKYFVSGAPEDYLDDLDIFKYKIISKKKNEKFEKLYDFIYTDIKN